MVILTRLSAGIEADNVVCFIIFFTYRHVVEVYCNDDEMAKLLIIIDITYAISTVCLVTFADLKSYCSAIIFL